MNCNWLNIDLLQLMIILLPIDSNSAAIGYRKALKIDYWNWCIYRYSGILLNFDFISASWEPPKNSVDSVSYYCVQTLSSPTQHIVAYTLSRAIH